MSRIIGCLRMNAYTAEISQIYWSFCAFHSSCKWNH